MSLSNITELGTTVKRGFTDNLQDVVDFINQSECSLKITLRTVQQWAENGTIEKNEAGFYDIGKILETRFTQGLSEEKVKWQRESARKLELANAETEKRLIPLFIAEKVQYESGAVYKSIFMSLVTTITKAVTGVTDKFEIEQTVKTLFIDAFKRCGDNLKTKDFKIDMEEEEK